LFGFYAMMTMGRQAVTKCLAFFITLLSDFLWTNQAMSAKYLILLMRL
jgi:hypothetical protein